jgi:hypothetical protein
VKNRTQTIGNRRGGVPALQKILNRPRFLRRRVNNFGELFVNLLLDEIGLRCPRFRFGKCEVGDPRFVNRIVIITYASATVFLAVLSCPTHPLLGLRGFDYFRGNYQEVNW